MRNMYTYVLWCNIGGSVTLDRVSNDRVMWIYMIYVSYNMIWMSSLSESDKIGTEVLYDMFGIDYV